MDSFSLFLFRNLAAVIAPTGVNLYTPGKWL
jgi:hypothetical protein